MNLRVRPFLKWAGGKFALSERVIAGLPNGKTLVEPFVGSGAIFLNSCYQRYLLNDINADLINCYQTLQRQGAQYIVDLKELFTQKNNNPERYYALREKFNASSDRYERALIFVYLNRHGYNGLCRYNRSGNFNVPFGRYKTPRFPEDQLHLFYVKSKRARFSTENFPTLFRKARRGQVFYCDPPYVPLSKTASFTDFAATGFSLDDQRALALEARKASQRGVPILISNHDTAFTRDIYAGARMSKFEARRSISCDASSRTPVAELLAFFAPPS